MTLPPSVLHFGTTTVATALFLRLVPMADKDAARNRPKGLIGVVGIIVFGAVFHLYNNLAAYDFYRFLLPHLPDWFIPIRFTISIALRLAFLTAAGGLLLLRERYRRLALWLWAFNLAAAYFKHPWIAIQQVMEMGLEIVGQRGVEQHLLDWPYHAHVLYAATMMMELAVSGLILIYLTRPWVRERFR